MNLRCVGLMSGSRTVAATLVVVTVSVMLASCATLPEDAEERAEVQKLNDPLEPANRRVYEFNRAFAATVLRPFVDAYNSAEMRPISEPFSNVLHNLRSPLIFANDFAQGRLCAAGQTLQRFLLNSTIGVAGLYDFAGREAGIMRHENSVAQTLSVWGVPEGSYLVLPLLGPSNVRGATGLGVEFLLDPTDLAFSALGFSNLIIVRTVAEVFDDQANSLGDLDKLEKSSLDGYAALRSAYRQHEADQFSESDCTERPLRQVTARTE